jgi:predicted metal-dependent hydrolase
MKAALASHEQIELSLGDRRAVAELRRSHRRVLRIEVQPSGNIVVFAPAGEGLCEIQNRVKRKSPWIFREIDRIANRPSITPERRFVSGETHLLLGRQYRLAIEQSEESQVRVEGGRLIVFARSVDDQAHCRRLITAFYKITARRVFNERLNVVAPPFLRKGMRRPSLMIRRMSKRWGSYTPSGWIVLNVDLVRVNPTLIDYVICHELAHAFHPDHGAKWRNLFNSVMPDWEERKSRLEAFLR